MLAGWIFSKNIMSIYFPSLSFSNRIELNFDLKQEQGVGFYFRAGTSAVTCIYLAITGASLQHRDFVLFWTYYNTQLIVYSN